MRVPAFASSVALLVAVPTTLSAQPAPGAEAPAPVVPMDAVHRALGESTPAATATASDALPAGTVRVLVVDAASRPVAGASVELGIMVREDSQRDSDRKESDASGVATFSGMPTGASQAYRVNVYSAGAKFSSTPFRLPEDRGYDVRITRLETTRDERLIMTLLHRTLVELRDERLHITQQLQLVNLSEQQYVFPDGAKRIALPEGFVAFQAEASMGDQRVAAIADEGVTIAGSLPPGRTNLVWAFDLPIDGREAMTFRSPVGFRTMQVRVDADAPPGLGLEVDGHPEATHYENQGRRVLVTMAQRRPGDAEALLPIVVRLTGIPAPPGAALRLVTAGAAAVFVLAALLSLLLLKPGVGFRTVSAELRRMRHRELLAEASDLEEAFASDEVGPRYREKRLGELVDQLALVLRDDAAAKATEGETKDKPRARSVKAYGRDALTYLALGLAFVPGLPFVGLFLVGSLRHALLAAAQAKKAERARYRRVAMGAGALTVAWLGALVAGTVWLAGRLM